MEVGRQLVINGGVQPGQQGGRAGLDAGNVIHSSFESALGAKPVPAVYPLCEAYQQGVAAAAPEQSKAVPGVNPAPPFGSGTPRSFSSTSIILAWQAASEAAGAV